MKTPTPTIDWAAGFLEGEGSFQWKACGTLQISAAQVQREPLLRLQAILGGSVYNVVPKKYNHQPFGMWTLGGLKAEAAMALLYPFMSPRRRQQIDSALQKRHEKPRRNLETCKRGHPFDVVLKDGKKRCRQCHNEAHRRYDQRRRERRQAAA